MKPLETYRRRHNLTYTALAGRMDVAVMTAWRWCNDPNRWPSRADAIRLAPLLGGELSLAELCGVADDQAALALQGGG